MVTFVVLLVPPWGYGNPSNLEKLKLGLRVTYSCKFFVEGQAMGRAKLMESTKVVAMGIVNFIHPNRIYRSDLRVRIVYKHPLGVYYILQCNIPLASRI